MPGIGSMVLFLLLFPFSSGCLSHRTPKPLPSPVNPSVAAAAPAAAVPAVTVTAVTVPAVSVPAVTIPAATLPTTAVSATALPVATVPATAQISKASDPSAASDRQDLPGPIAPSETSRKVQVVVERIVNDVVHMQRVTLIGLVAIVAMLVFYSLANRSPVFTLAFAAACWIGSAYGFLHWPWPFGMVGGIGGIVALRKWLREMKAQNGGAGNAQRLALVWLTRFVCVAAVICGVVLLIVDSPVSTRLPIPVSRAVVEAAPLLLVGVALLAWLAIERPTAVDFIKQALIAVAFILWGVDLLMPAGPWATFVGAVVIAIYVFDLAWLIEANVRKKFDVQAE